MKLFSNFDTDLDKKRYEKYAKVYWEEKIYIIYKDKFFYFFKVILPIALYLLAVLFFVCCIYFIDLSSGVKNFLRIVFLFFFFISFFFVWRKVLVNMIDYKMDFILVTPDEIVCYNQTGLFSRASRSLDVDKLKTISVQKKGILRSFFNYGKLVFLSEGDTNTWDIEFNFTSNPDDTKYKIKQIIETYNNYSKKDL